MKTESGKYLYLTNREISLVTSLLKTKKRNEDEESLLSTVIYQSKLSSESYPKYRKAAEEKLKKIDAYAFDNEEVIIDPDANVSETREGAYIHCWLWVDAEKPKRTRKRTVKNG